jgi:hypothetical protein
LYYGDHGSHLSETPPFVVREIFQSEDQGNSVRAYARSQLQTVRPLDIDSK